MKGNKKNKNGQSFSVDILVVIVVLLFGGLFVVMTKIDSAENQNIEVKYEQAAVDSKILVENFKTNGIIDSENNVNVEKLLLMDDQQIKEELGIKNDFAIVFEKDGKLVKIDSDKGVNCVGSSEIIVNGVSCK